MAKCFLESTRLASPGFDRGISDESRSRVTALVDPNSGFLELSPLAGQDLYPGEEVPAAGLIAGIGKIHGIPCMIVANDSTSVLFGSEDIA